MIQAKSDKIIEDALDNPILIKNLKIAGVAISAVIGLYLLGHIFKIGAHTINGFKDLKKSIQNGR